VSAPDANRLREDLATLRHAAALEPTFSRDDVLASLVFAAAGAALAAGTAFVPGEYRRPLAIVFVVVFLAIWAVLVTRARRARAARPATWREHRLNLVAALILIPATIAYMRWERQIGLPRETVGAAAVVFVGHGVFLVGVLTRGRAHYIGSALPLIAFGLAIPFCTPQQVLIAAGLCLVVAGLAAAALQSRQLRSA
jgi:FtsH-binding integral membrane protein